MYNYPPPIWQYPPPDNKTYERAMHLAMKIAHREEREKERKKNIDRKNRQEDQQRAANMRRTFWLGIELYIFGILSQPFVLYGYKHLLTTIQ